VGAVHGLEWVTSKPLQLAVLMAPATLLVWDTEGMRLCLHQLLKLAVRLCLHLSLLLVLPLLLSVVGCSVELFEPVACLDAGGAAPMAPATPLVWDAEGGWAGGCMGWGLEVEPAFVLLLR